MTAATTPSPATTTGNPIANRPHSMRLPGYTVHAGPFTHLVDEHNRLAGLTWQHFQARRVGATLGAEISGIDLTAELPDAAIDEIRRALHEYKVLFFRDQPLTSAAHVAFARRFGELEVHPFLPGNSELPELVRFEKSAQVAGFENSWHHDVTWRERPSMGAILHAIAVPELGGDTLFSDMYAAYDLLDEETKARIENLDAIHDYTRAFGFALDEEARAQMRAKFPSVRHPVVCTHPATGRKHLYVNRVFTERIEGLEPEESRALIDQLCRAADAPEHQVRLHWQPDTVAFWDNAAVQHYAASDYWPQVRIMERASIIGPRPTR